MPGSEKCPNDGSLLRDIGEGMLQCPICPFNVPGNKKVLEGMYVWVSVDEKGREGFMAVQLAGNGMVLCHSELSMAKKLKHLAVHALSTVPGYHARLIHFSSRRIIEDCP